eukprot:UN12018
MTRVASQSLQKGNDATSQYLPYFELSFFIHSKKTWPIIFKKLSILPLQFYFILHVQHHIILVFCINLHPRYHVVNLHISVHEHCGNRGGGNPILMFLIDCYP